MLNIQKNWKDDYLLDSDCNTISKLKSLRWGKKKKKLEKKKLIKKKIYSVYIVKLL